MSETIHMRVTVNDDDHEVDLFIRDGRLGFTTGEDARTIVAGGHAIPGLVDAHAHLPFASPAPPASSVRDKAEASAGRQLEAGVLAVRDPGGPTPIELETAIGLPHILTGGRFLAAPGRMFPDHGQIDVTNEELPEAAEGQLRHGASWVKIIGDFPVPERGFVPSFRPEAIADAVERIHAMNGRIAVHAVAEETIEAAIEAGVDSIEHGLMITENQAGRMAERGLVLVPTMVSTSAWLPQVLTQIGAPEEAVRGAARAVEAQPQMVRSAWESGGRLLAGTDAGLVPHGLVMDEIRLFADTGIPAVEALAAGSWGARHYLGLPGIEAGAPADLVVYERSPLEDPMVLHDPILIMLGGNIVLDRAAA